jgi:hypothetical protein
MLETPLIEGGEESRLVPVSRMKAAADGLRWYERPPRNGREMLRQYVRRIGEDMNADGGLGEMQAAWRMVDMKLGGESCRHCRQGVERHRRLDLLRRQGRWRR